MQTKAKTESAKPAPFEIALADIVEKARLALENGTLGALNHQVGAYAYEDGSRCAIGAAMSYEQIDVIRYLDLNHGSVAGLIKKNVVKVAADERHRICDLQRLHDNWAVSGQADEGRFFQSPEMQNFLGDSVRAVDVDLFRGALAALARAPEAAKAEGR